MRGFRWLSGKEICLQAGGVGSSGAPGWFRSPLSKVTTLSIWPLEISRTRELIISWTTVKYEWMNEWMSPWMFTTGFNFMFPCVTTYRMTCIYHYYILFCRSVCQILSLKVCFLYCWLEGFFLLSGCNHASDLLILTNNSSILLNMFCVPIIDFVYLMVLFWITFNFNEVQYNSHFMNFAF